MFNIAVQPEKIVDCSIQNDVYCYRIRWCDSWVSHDSLPDSWQYLVDDFWKKQTEQQIQEPLQNQDDPNRLIHSMNTKFLPHFSTLLVGESEVNSQQQNLISTQSPSDTLGPLEPPALFTTAQPLGSLSTQQATFTLTAASLRDNQLDISGVGDFQIPLFEQTSQPAALQLIHQQTQQIEISSISNTDEQTTSATTDHQPSKTTVKIERKKKEPAKTTKFTLTTKTNKQTTCEECSRDFSKTSNPRKRLREHIRRVHLKNGKFHCTDCPKTFVCSQGLRDHEPVHSKERKHSCTYCGQTFLRSSHLYIHTRTHEEEKNFSCEGCVFTCNVQSELKEHCENTHSDITIDIKCSICKQNLFSSQSIYSHSLRHSGSRDWKCDVCGSAFKRKQILDQHMKRHSKDRNMFSCDNCSKDFTTRSTLKQHLYIVHNRTIDGAEHKCEVCGKCFKNWANYNRHVGLHPKVNDTSLNNVERDEGGQAKDFNTSGTDDFTCNVCKSHHDTLSQLLEHLQQHQVEEQNGVETSLKDSKERKCDTCQKLQERKQFKETFRNSRHAGIEM
uniref:C2H2-type domain-containing protein n=2 Tax=Clytia hemisphaerica TaxID=252671 RepID=A0A7M5V4W0_9CNID